MTKNKKSYMGKYENKPSCSTLNLKKHSYKKIALTAILSRIILFVGITISYTLFPDIYPGDDVMQFDLRLNVDNNDNVVPFCLVHNNNNDNDCNEYEYNKGTISIHTMISKNRFYKNILTGLTRWDAARFLNIATFEQSRYNNNNNHNPQQCNDNNNNYNEEDNCFVLSEQAHAFFPLYPLIIRFVCNNILLRYIPTALLPSTHEGVMVLSGLLVNNIAFVLSAMLLFHLTLCTIPSNDINNSNNVRIAEMCSILFSFNPASIFFSTNYSESIFVFLTLLGYICIYNHHLVLSTIPWMLASYTRSNGIVHSIFYIIHAALSSSIDTLSNHHHMAIILKFIKAIILSCLLWLPMIYHDYNGYIKHCKTDYNVDYLTITPSWCNDNTTSSIFYFSLYSYVQKKHWNVALFNYYTITQIPNFILAAPVVLIVFYAAYTFFFNSYYEFIEQSSQSPATIYQWIISILQHHYHDNNPNTKNNTTMQHNYLIGPKLLPYYIIMITYCLLGVLIAHVQITTRMICSSSPAFYWFIGYTLIRDYNKHHNNTGNDVPSMKDIIVHQYYSKESIMSKIILLYFLLYILLGIVMHVNWLPWT